MNDMAKQDKITKVLDIICPNETPTPEVINFTEECVEMIRLYSKKNHDYGNSFNNGMNVIGLPYGVGRMYDKMSRILTLMKVEAQIKDERIIDTIQDLACYAVMLASYINNSTLVTFIK